MSSEDFEILDSRAPYSWSCSQIAGNRIRLLGYLRGSCQSAGSRKSRHRRLEGVSQG